MATADTWRFEAGKRLFRQSGVASFQLQQACFAGRFLQAPPDAPYDLPISYRSLEASNNSELSP